MALRVAVSGGTGFIGAPLVRALLERGHSVKVLVRDAEEAQVPQGAKIASFVAGEKLAPYTFDDVDAVIHLAGEPIAKYWSGAHKDRIRRSRVEGTKTLAEGIALAGGVQTLISGSAIGYYGPHQDESLDESAPAGSDFLSMVCQGWEQATDAARRSGTRVAISRTGVVLHPEGGALKKMMLPFKLGLGGRSGTGFQYVSWIHRDDLVDLLVFALEKPTLSGPFNATAPVPVTNDEFARTLGAAMHRPSFMPAPGFALKLLLGEGATVVLTGQRVLPKKALAAGFPFKHRTLKGALADLFGA
jgi:uncharacterized protein (TIGR01777 family)